MIETWKLSETGINPILSPDGKWIIAGSGKASITNTKTRVTTVFAQRGYVGGFISNSEARMIDGDLNTIYSMKLENNWIPIPITATYKKGNTYAVADNHSAINRRAPDDNNIILDDILLVGDHKNNGCSLANNVLVFSHDEGDPSGRWWLYVYNAATRTLIDKFKPQIGANIFRTNYGYISYGYNSACWIRTPSKGNVNISVASNLGTESPACIIFANGNYWALSQFQYHGTEKVMLILRPLGDTRVIQIPFGAVYPYGVFVDGFFWVVGALTNGVMNLAKIPLDEPRKPILPLTEPEPPVPGIPNHKDVVERMRAKYDNMPQGNKRGYTITNASAYELRAEGAGMFFKDSGNNYNDRNINCILYKHRPGIDPPGKGEMYDVLKSAETYAEPQWNRTKPTGYGDISKWREPVKPDDVTPDPIPPADPDKVFLLHIRNEINEYLGDV